MQSLAIQPLNYYLLWSIERVAMAFDLQKNRWQGLVPLGDAACQNQQPNGSWAGIYSGGGVDTCFALLFLSRSNLAPDLTANCAVVSTIPARYACAPGKQTPNRGWQIPSQRIAGLLFTPPARWGMPARASVYTTPLLSRSFASTAGCSCVVALTNSGSICLPGSAGPTRAEARNSSAI